MYYTIYAHITYNNNTYIIYNKNNVSILFLIFFLLNKSNLLQSQHSFSNSFFFNLHNTYSYIIILIILFKLLNHFLYFSKANYIHLSLLHIITYLIVLTTLTYYQNNKLTLLIYTVYIIYIIIISNNNYNFLLIFCLNIQSLKIALFVYTITILLYQKNKISSINNLKHKSYIIIFFFHLSLLFSNYIDFFVNQIFSEVANNISIVKHYYNFRFFNNNFFFENYIPVFFPYVYKNYIIFFSDYNNFQKIASYLINVGYLAVAIPIFSLV